MTITIKTDHTGEISSQRWIKISSLFGTKLRTPWTKVSALKHIQEHIFFKIRKTTVDVSNNCCCIHATRSPHAAVDAKSKELVTERATLSKLPRTFFRTNQRSNCRYTAVKPPVFGFGSDDFPARRSLFSFSIVREKS